jgi:hypothetical protein
VKDASLLLLLIIHLSTEDMKNLNKAFKNLALQPKNFERRKPEPRPIMSKDGKGKKKMKAKKSRHRTFPQE